MSKTGTFKAKIVDYGLKKSEGKGTLGLNVKFLTDEGVNYYWTAWLTEKTKERVLTNLVETKLLQTNDMKDFANGPKSDALSMSQEVEIVVKGEEASNGKTYYNVKWVNPVGSSSMKGVIETQEALNQLEELNLNDTLAQVMAELGVNELTPKPEYTSDEIPF